MDTKIEFLFLNEEDMLKAGVLDAGRCVDTVGEVMKLLSKGDCLMGGKEHNDHGVQLIFPEKSEIAGFPLADSADRRFMAVPDGGREVVWLEWTKYSERTAAFNPDGDIK